MAPRQAAEPGSAKRQPQKNPIYSISSTDDIKKILRLSDVEALKQGLTALRNRLTIRHDEKIDAADDRLRLVQVWQTQSPGGQDLFEVWDKHAQNAGIVTLLLAIFAYVLNLLSEHFIYHSLGTTVLKGLLASTYLRRLNAGVTGSQTDLILNALKLWNAMSDYAGGQERRTVMEGFSWGSKSLPKLFFMRRKGSNSSKSDIRTLYIAFILSFLSPSAPSNIKLHLLEHHSDAYTMMFRGLHQDHYRLVRMILENAWEGIWCDPRIKRTLKVSLFNEGTLHQIIKIYESDDSTTVDVAHHFLLAICTRPGTGICFRDQGWYPREADGEEAERIMDEKHEHEHKRSSSGGKGVKVYNKILANILKSLKPVDDPRQQELVLKICEACPELVAGYWSSSGLALEPRLSSKWIATIAFAGSIISLPPPTSTLKRPGPVTGSSQSTSYRPTPPQLPAILSNILPSQLSKTHLTKGLQLRAAPLVQHYTALTLVRCLEKYLAVRDVFEEIVLEEEDGEGGNDAPAQLATAYVQARGQGQWSLRISDMEKEMRKRAPDFQVLVAFAQPRSTTVPSKEQQKETAPEPKEKRAPNLVQDALLAEVSLRLIWLYHRALPSLVAEARFGVGRLLLLLPGGAASKGDLVSPPEIQQKPIDDDVAMDDIDESELASGMEKNQTGKQAGDNASRLGRACRLHALRLLRVSDQFVWSDKSGSSKHSHLHQLLRLYLSLSQSPSPVAKQSPSFSSSSIESASRDLVVHCLSTSLLFEHDPDEVDIWINSLPKLRPSSELSAGTGTTVSPLRHGPDALLAFLDECVLRCLKTPYRYIEENLAILSTGTPYTPTDLSSPIFITLLEQLGAKIRANLLTSCATLEICTYIRRLLFGFLGKQPDVRYVQEMTCRLGVLVADTKATSSDDDIDVWAACRAQVAMLNQAILVFDNPLQVTPVVATSTVQAFLTQIEAQPMPSAAIQAKEEAHELVDWLRLNALPLQLDDLVRIANFIKQRYPPALEDFFWQIHPEWGYFWEINNRGPFDKWMSFEWAYLSATSTQLVDSTTIEALGRLLLQTTRPARAFVILDRRMAGGDDEVTLGSLKVIMAFYHSRKDAISTKQYLFTEATAFRSLLFSSSVTETIRQALDNLVEVALDPLAESDRALAIEYAEYWSMQVGNGSANLQDNFSSSFRWIKLLDWRTTLQYLDAVFSVFTPHLQYVLDEVLKRLLQLSLSFPSPSSLDPYISRLAMLKTQLSSPFLDQFLSSLLEGRLPLNHDASSRPPAGNVATIMGLAESRWKASLAASKSPLKIGFDMVDILDEASFRTAAATLYLSKDARTNFADQINSIQSVPSDGYCVVIDAYLQAGGEEAAARCQHLFASLVKMAFGQRSSERSPASVNALIVLIRDQTSDASERVRILLAGTQSARSVTGVALDIALACTDAAAIYMSVSVAVVERLLTWLVDVLGDEGEVPERSKRIIKKFYLLLDRIPEIKAHLVEPAFAVALRNHLHLDYVVDVLNRLASKSNLKPVNVNKSVQTMVQHRQLVAIASPKAENQSARSATIRLLHTLFHLHPSNTCQPTHVSPLIQLYGGTLSPANRHILSIFQLFETQRAVSCAELLCQWTNGGTTPVSTLDAMVSFDSTIMFRTCTAFPMWRDAEPEDKIEDHTESGEIYDPLFVLLLLAKFLSEDVDPSALQWVELFRTNAISLAMCGMISRKPGMRKLASYVLAGMWTYTKTADFQERDHVCYILDLFRDLLPSASTQTRLPAYPVLLLAHALRGVFYPSSFVYPLTSRFLLQRPEIDKRDVPMLYNMLYSSSDGWRKERAWIIRFIAEGMKGSEDWRILKRRHTWDLLASLFQSPIADALARKGILEVLANVCCNKQAAMSIILRNMLLPWIEIQMPHILPGEEVAWVKILENIVYIVDWQKVETATKTEWRAIITRALGCLLHRTKRLPMLYLIARVLLRISLLPIHTTLSTLLEQCITTLRSFEADIQIPPSASPCNADQQIPGPPHFHLADGGLYYLVEGDNDYAIWSATVVMLWRVAQTQQPQSQTEVPGVGHPPTTSKMLGWWDALTCRLIVDGTSLESEWARRTWVAAAVAS